MKTFSEKLNKTYLFNFQFICRFKLFGFHRNKIELRELPNGKTLSAEE